MSSLPNLSNPQGKTIKFAYQQPQLRLLRQVTRGKGVYLKLAAPQVLEVGGQRSGKTMGKLKFGVEEYCLRYGHCDILVLRRKFSELESGVIQDFKTMYKDFIDKQPPSCKYNDSKHTATFLNGSRVVFGGCVNNRDKDIEQYLGSAWSFILVDECAQFSPDAWEMLNMRNLVNAGCEYDEHGNLPVPSMAGCTNPVGPFWDYYYTQFAKQAKLGEAGIGKGEPFLKEGLIRAEDGSWWAPTGDGGHRLAYDPRNYAVNHSTMLENEEFQKRDPMALNKLRAMPEAKQKKFLYGLLDRVEGQYFECFSHEEDVIDLREDSQAVIWQPWQPVWGGQDWGMGHWNAFYLFTKALVRRSVGEDYKLKTLCFQEVAPQTTGHTAEEMADMISAKAYYPRLPENHPQYAEISGKRCTVRAIYFSHEKFNRVMERHSPADEYSNVLRKRGLPAVSRGTQDRIGSAAFLYSLIKKRELAILKTCPGIIQALPQLQRDPRNLDDVLKSNSVADDRYDAFRLGIYGELGTQGKPEAQRLQEEANLITDPFMRALHKYKQVRDRAQRAAPQFASKAPSWKGKL